MSTVTFAGAVARRADPRDLPQDLRHEAVPDAITPNDRERSPAAPGLGLELRGVEKAFGPRRVLAGIDLTVPPGGFVAVVGRSGGGKSTLMRLLCGLDRATRGEVRVGGRVVPGIDPSVRLMFQDARLLPWQTVLSNVGISRGPDWQAAARVALSDVGLADREREWPAVLSGGQRQRVALARALVGRPGVLLLDEPFGALDAMTRAEMHVLLDRLWRARRFTAVLITHDVAEAVALADRVVVLADGRIAADVPVPLARDNRHGPAAAQIRDRILAAV